MPTEITTASRVDNFLGADYITFNGLPDRYYRESRLHRWFRLLLTRLLNGWRK